MGISGQAGSSSQTGNYQEKEKKKMCWWAFRGLAGETAGDYKGESKNMRNV